MTLTLDDTLGVERGAPRHYSFTEPFWEGTRHRKLLLQYCLGSGKFQFFPRPISIHNGSRNLEWREVSGRGAVFTYMVTHVARPPFDKHVPNLVVTVTLDEGVNISANLINCGMDRVAIGLRVRPAWAPLPDGTNLLLFEPDD